MTRGAGKRTWCLPPWRANQLRLLRLQLRLLLALLLLQLQLLLLWLQLHK